MVFLFVALALFVLHKYTFVPFCIVCVVRRQSCKNEVRSQTKTRKEGGERRRPSHLIYIVPILLLHNSRIQFHISYCRDERTSLVLVLHLNLCFFFFFVSFRGRVKNERK